MTRKLPLGLLFSSSAGIETADKAIYGAKNRLRHDLIGYLKRMPDGSNLYFEEIRTGRRTTRGRQCRGPGAHRRGHARGPGLEHHPRAPRERHARPATVQSQIGRACTWASIGKGSLIEQERGCRCRHSFYTRSNHDRIRRSRQRKEGLQSWRLAKPYHRPAHPRGRRSRRNARACDRRAAKVNQDVDMGPRDGERVDVELNGYTAVVSLYRFGNKEAWLLTGFKGLPKGYPSTHWATHPKCLVSHSEWLQILLAG